MFRIRSLWTNRAADVLTRPRREPSFPAMASLFLRGTRISGPTPSRGRELSLFAIAHEESRHDARFARQAARR
jgi:hypothetical protein